MCVLDSYKKHCETFRTSLFTTTHCSPAAFFGSRKSNKIKVTTRKVLSITWAFKLLPSFLHTVGQLLRTWWRKDSSLLNRYETSRVFPSSFRTSEIQTRQSNLGSGIETTHQFPRFTVVGNNRPRLYVTWQNNTVVTVMAHSSGKNESNIAEYVVLCVLNLVVHNTITV